MEQTPTSPQSSETQQPQEQAPQETQEIQAPQEETTEIPMTTDEIQDVTPETLYADKFKSVSDLENSYKELQSTFSKKLGAFGGYDEETGYALPEEFSGYDEGLSGAIQEWGKENQLSNEGYNQLVQGYTEYESNKRQARMQEEFNKLGENADTRLNNVEDFLVSNLGADQAGALSSSIQNAGAIEAIESLMQKISAVPSVSNVQTAPVSPDKIKAMRFATNENGERLMSIDPTYRSKVLKMESQIQK